MGESPNVRIDHILKLGDYSGRQESASIRKKRQKLNDAAEYVAEEFLREIDPMPWYRAITGLVPLFGLRTQRFNKKWAKKRPCACCAVLFPNFPMLQTCKRDDKDD